MIGLTKKDVERIIRDCNIDNEHKEIAGTLREECHELDPWLPIEGAPKDGRSLLLKNSRIFGVGFWDKTDNCWFAFGIVPTHYKEIDL